METLDVFTYDIQADEFRTSHTKTTVRETWLGLGELAERAEREKYRGKFDDYNWNELEKTINWMNGGR